MNNEQVKLPSVHLVDQFVEHTRKKSRYRRVYSTLACINGASAVASHGDVEAERFPNTDTLDPDDEHDREINLLLAIEEPCDTYFETGDGLLLPPQGKAWARIRSNITPPEDCKQEFYVPYLGEADEDLDASSKLADDLMDDERIENAKRKHHALTILRKSPYADALNDQFKQQADDSDAEEELLDHNYKNRTTESYAQGWWNRAFKREAIFRCVLHYRPAQFKETVRLLANVLGINSDSVIRYFSNALFRRHKWAMKDKHERIVQEHRESVRKWIRTEERTSTIDILESNSVGFFFCRRCKIHDCSLHGVGVDLIPKITSYDASRKANLKPEGKAMVERECKFAGTGKCFYFWERSANGILPNGVSGSSYGSSITTTGNSSTGIGAPIVVNLISDDEESEESEEITPIQPFFESNEGARLLLERFRIVFGDDNCRLAETLNSLGMFKEITCFEVGKYCNDFLGPVNSAADEKPKKPKSTKRKDYCLSKQEREVLIHGKRKDYTPCNHEGPCTVENGCICKKHGLLCEKYCNCCSPRVNGSRTHEVELCSNFYPGCICKSSGKGSGCTTNKCDCVALKRECDPDFCRCCKDCSSGRPTACQNQSLRKNAISRIVCGHSSVHGWGSYASSFIKKGALIGQYTGEIIPDNDAERRGRVYDKQNTSFLFKLTEDFEIDATRIGNKLRYINHSTNYNCEPQILRVDGDVVIGIFANRDIAAFEELLFDYGYGKDGPEFARGSDKGAKRSRIDDTAAMKSGTKQRSIVKEPDDDEVNESNIGGATLRR